VSLIAFAIDNLISREHAKRFLDEKAKELGAIALERANGDTFYYFGETASKLLEEKKDG
jgi:hypothetical protein